MTIPTIPKLSSLDLLLTGFKMGKFNGEQCWDLITEADLWPDREEIIQNIADGREIARTRNSLVSAPPHFLERLSALLRAAEAPGYVPFDARRSIERLFQGGA